MKTDESDSEFELIEKARSGDRVAIGRLLVDYDDQLVEFVRRRSSEFILQRVGIEELLTQVRAAVFRGISSFEPRGASSFGAWLRQVAHNRIVDAYRRESRNREVQLGADSCVDLFDQLLATCDTPSVEVIRAEKIQAVRLAIATLENRKYRLALELKHLQQKDNEQIAEEMNCTTGAVRGYLDRGKKEMLAALGRESQYFSRG